MRGTGVTQKPSIGKFSVANQKKLTPIPKIDPQNPHINEDYEPCHSNMSQAKVFKGHLMGVTSLAYNSKKDILATGSDDTTWKLWSVPNGDLLMSGEGHSDWIGGVCFHPKGNFLATASGDGYIKIWDFINAKCAMQYSEHGQPVWKVDYHHDGDFLLSCSMDHTVKLWDMNLPNSSRFTFRGHVDSVNSVQWCPYSTMFVSGAGDKTVSLWDIRSNLCI
jgi:sperm-associated antigen 16 protein